MTDRTTFALVTAAFVLALAETIVGGLRGLGLGTTAPTLWFAAATGAATILPAELRTKSPRAPTLALALLAFALMGQLMRLDAASEALTGWALVAAALALVIHIRATFRPTP